MSRTTTGPSFNFIPHMEGETPGWKGVQPPLRNIDVKSAQYLTGFKRNPDTGLFAKILNGFYSLNIFAEKL